ncbi:MAG TPA: hypothetical protein VFQ45_20080 [Longimicrobium sp.]|nr:hypothetical protein [Longimicrobium sp.]
MQTPSPLPRPENRAPAARAPYVRPTLEALGSWSARTLQVTGYVVTPADVVTRNHA